jgi:Cu/Ag efflux pump CusA
MNIFNKIVATSLKYRYLVVFLAAVFMILGIGLIRNMPIDVFPEFAPPRVEVQTPSLGLSSAEVESLVTIPLEQALAGTPGLDVMRSKSVNQLSSILLIFDQGTDIMEARQLVQERMSIATPQLPRWASPPVMLPPLSSTARTLKIGLTSDEYNLRELSMITYWKIRERLLRVPGVANVAIWGEQIDMLTVQVDPELMAAHNVSMDEVLQVTSDTLDVGLIQYSEGSEVGAGGFLETPNQRMPIFQILPVVTAEDLANVPINDRTKIDGSPLRLGDVADTIMDTWPMIGDAVVNDRDGLLLIIEKFPWANTVQVTHGLEAAMEESSR